MALQILTWLMFLVVNFCTIPAAPTGPHQESRNYIPDLFQPSLEVEDVSDLFRRIVPDLWKATTNMKNLSVIDEREDDQYRRYLQKLRNAVVTVQHQHGSDLEAQGISPKPEMIQISMTLEADVFRWLAMNVSKSLMNMQEPFGIDGTSDQPLEDEELRRFALNLLKAMAAVQTVTNHSPSITV